MGQIRPNGAVSRHFHAIADGSTAFHWAMHSLSLAVARLAETHRLRLAAPAACGALALLAVPAGAANGVEKDNLAVAALIAPDAAFYLGVENAGGGLRELAGVSDEVGDLVQGLLAGEEEAQRWAQVAGGDWGFAYSDEMLAWSRMSTEVHRTTLVEALKRNLAAQFDLVAGRIEPEEYLQASVLGGDGGDTVVQRLMASCVRNLPGTGLPGLALVVRPSTDEARDFLIGNVEGFAAQLARNLPPSIAAAEQRVGKFGCRTWSVDLDRMLADSGMSSQQLAQQLAAQGDLKPDEVTALGQWFEQLTLVVGYGWSDDGSTFTLFYGPSTDEVPLSTGEESLLTTEPGLAQLAAGTAAGGARLDTFVSRGTAETQVEAIWDSLLGGLADGVLAACGENTTDARAKTIGRATTSLRQTLDAFRPRVSGHSVTSISLSGDRLTVDSLNGTHEPGLDLSQPIRYAAALEGDQPLVMAGAINSAAIEAGLQTLADSVTLFSASASLGNDVARARNPAAASVEVLGSSDPHQWLRSDEGQRVIETLGRVGDRLGQGLGQQGVLTMDFAGVVPAALEEQIEEAQLPGMPRLTFMADVANPAALEGAWGDVAGSVNQALAAMDNAAAPDELPLPVDVEVDGVKSWFYAFGPATNDDFMPTLSRTGGQLIIGSSLKQQRALAALAAAPAPADGQALTGRFTRIRLGELLRQTLSENETRSLIGDVADGLGGSSMPGGELAGLGEADEVVEFLRETMGDIELWERAEGDRVRQTLTVEIER